MLSFEQYADFLAASARGTHAAAEVALGRVLGHAKTMAVEYIGHELPEWRPLAASTIAQKRRLGFTNHVSPTDPGLRTGEMRDSIVTEQRGLTGTLGGSSQKLVWFELGTSKQPPRPVLALAAANSQEYMGEVYGETAVALLVPPSERIGRP